MSKSFRYYQIVEVLAGNPPKLGLTENGQPIGSNDMLVFNKKVDGMKRHERYRIRFSIKNFQNSPFRFVPVPAGVTKEDSDVMWVQRGNACPTDYCKLPDVIWVDEVDDDGEWIEVLNKDKVPEHFWFTLNFVNKAIQNPTKADYIPLDPGGDNQNHGEPFMEFIAASTLTGCVVGLGTVALTSGDQFVAATGLTYALGGAILGLIMGLIFDRM